MNVAYIYFFFLKPATSEEHLLVLIKTHFYTSKNDKKW